MQTKPSERFWQRFNTLLAITLLFILPAGSWWYLSQGLDYRRDSLSEMKDFGPIGDFTGTDQVNRPFRMSEQHGKALVVQFLPPDRTEAAYRTERLGKVFESFQDTEDVLFLSIAPADSLLPSREQAIRLGIDDARRWRLLTFPDTSLERISTQVFGLADAADQRLVLADTSLTMRRYYNIRENEDMGRLVEQIAIVIPKQRRR